MKWGVVFLVLAVILYAGSYYAILVDERPNQVSYLVRQEDGALWLERMPTYAFGDRDTESIFWVWNKVDRVLRPERWRSMNMEEYRQHLERNKKEV